jgi:hypothetical protein
MPSSSGSNSNRSKVAFPLVQLRMRRGNSMKEERHAQNGCARGRRKVTHVSRSQSDREIRACICLFPAAGEVGGAGVRHRPPDSYADLLLGLLCDPDNEGVMFLRNIGIYRITCLYDL